MIERYSLGVSAKQVGDFFGVEPYGFERPRFNAAPAQLLPVITMGSAGLSHFYWGTMPQWARNKSLSEKVINVRAELIPERPTIRKLLKKFRCVVPADGFYAWKKVGKKTTIPYRFQLPDKSLFGMAGLWEEFDDETGEMFHTFTLITQPANEAIAPVCERMPFVLNKMEVEIWLKETSEENLLQLAAAPNRAKMENYTISPRINSPLVDEASLIQPAPPADQFGNLTLFS